MTEWQLVPKEPTEEMLLPLDNYLRPAAAKELLKHVLAVASKPEPTVWYNIRNGDTESIYNSMMGDNWIPLYALKET